MPLTNLNLQPTPEYQHRIGGNDVAMFRASNRVHQEITIVKFSIWRAVSTFAFGGPKGDGDTLVCLKNLHRIMHC